MIRERRKWLEWITFPTCEELRPSLRRVYMQSDCRTRLPLFVRRPFSTLIIDLTRPVEAIQSDYQPVARYEIRRAAKDRLKVWYDTEVEDVIRLFALTSRARGLNAIDEATFSTKPEFIVSHAARKDTGTLCAHFYLPDRERRRVWLGYNCSAYRKFGDAGRRSLCGRANRFLFHRDLLYFKEQGFETFDFGGYDPLEPDPSLRPVNRFKETFGGMVEQQYNYYPLWYFLFRLWRQKLGRR